MDRAQPVALLYFAASCATFLYLTFFDDYPYNAWNWLIAVPVNGFLSTIWPIYWALLHWIS
ncbi:hypothetical protein GXW78_17015 [Roseomonas terrae]|uniref:Uncharacterized protein n=2 Tax=Neoroseomonas terrae TaxID=424799 RepID=A0ABS5EK26_9PROT|nr:hypothetical protein [Neoroseomonas terrae]